ncbi:VCBS domain-containing protein, partial [Chromobacterium piscinae]
YSQDGTSHDITVVVTGVNDAAAFSGNDQGAVTEDANVSAANTLDYSGKLNVVDPDQGQSVFDTSWARARPAPRCSPSTPRTAPPTTSPWSSPASMTP